MGWVFSTEPHPGGRSLGWGAFILPLRSRSSGAVFVLEIEFCGDVAVDVVANSLLDELLGNREALGQLPDLGAAVGDGIVQILRRDQLAAAALVRLVEQMR